MIRPFYPRAASSAASGESWHASVNGPGIGYGLFGSRVKLLGCKHRRAAIDPRRWQPSPLHLRSTRRISAGSALPSYFWPTRRRHPINRRLPHRSLNAQELDHRRRFPARPLEQSFRTLRVSSSCNGAAPPTRSILTNQAPAAQDPGAARDRNAANLEQVTARTFGVSDLSLSKSGAPVVSPPPQPH